MMYVFALFILSIVHRCCWGECYSFTHGLIFCLFSVTTQAHMTASHMSWFSIAYKIVVYINMHMIIAGFNGRLK